MSRAVCPLHTHPLPLITVLVQVTAPVEGRGQAGEPLPLFCTLEMVWGLKKSRSPRNSVFQAANLRFLSCLSETFLKACLSQLFPCRLAMERVLPSDREYMLGVKYRVKVAFLSPDPGSSLPRKLAC